MKDFPIESKSDFDGFYKSVNAYFVNNPFEPFVIWVIMGKKRSLKQNALLHTVFADCAKQTGIKNAKWWKDDLKLKFGVKYVHLGIDNEHEGTILKSTADYTTKELGDFLQVIVSHMMCQYEVEILLPDELEQIRKLRLINNNGE